MRGRVILVTAVGGASGSRAAAAALACAGSEPDRAALLIDIGGRPPRPTLVASAGARELEERLALHLPTLRSASRGQTCHLAVPDEGSPFESVLAALPLARQSAAVVHLPPRLFRSALETSGLDPTGVLLRADVVADRALTALAVRALVERGLRVRVLKQPLAWVAARRALFGVPQSTNALPPRLTGRLLHIPKTLEGNCYRELDDQEADTA